ncbi:MAG: hypothetical protein O3B03_01245 [Proteobacteria bacterium]|nr:hypothetical protein [Pseudomonadota bacterium]
MSYQVIESVVLLLVVSGSLIYLMNRWLPNQKVAISQIVLRFFPWANSFITIPDAAAGFRGTKSAKGCFGCEPTGACGKCPTNNS